MVLSAEEKKKRKKERDRKYYEKNKEKLLNKQKKYYENNKEQRADYYEKWRETDNGKKSLTIANWKRNGLIENKEFLEEIYELYLNQEECNACGITLTRTGKCSNTDVTMDHDHSTGKFRHIICGYCNRKDNWKKYFIQ